ncbi:ABC transporter permease [Tepidamorphus sp. 3E244]|uniref:ABC transporter permease n=1 Tax=Tepidamorphus sp. 3E244 TaxID=3385498 RepID=UPI0038FC11A2
MTVAAIHNGYRFEDGGEVLRFKPFGSWIIRNLTEVERALSDFTMPENGRSVVIDLSDLEKIDVSGAWLIHRSAKQLAAANHAISFESVGRAARILLQEVAESDRPMIPEPPKPAAARVLVEDAGKSVISSVGDMRRLTELIGAMVSIGFSIVRHPSKLRVTPILYHLEQSGVRAIPIVALITFVIGAIVAQQSIYQLRDFGAEQLAVNFVGIVILRELGVLLTAIMVAGRSGSAFTAEVGAMKMREEIDAVRTLALDPIEVIIVPRLTALVIAVPLLTFIGNFSALTAAAVVSFVYGGVPIDLFIERLRDQVDLINFTRGIIKAPFMAVVIGLVAVLEGLQVVGSTDSLGKRTTASVVKSIFLVIVIDGIFVLYYAMVDG